MADLATSIRIAQAFGITSAAFAAGFSFTISDLAVPPILQAPAHVAVRQWAVLFKRGLALGPALAIASGASLGYLAYSAPSSLVSRLYTASTVSILGIIPFTRGFIVKTNNKLFSRLDAANKLGKGEEMTEAGVPQGEKIHDLISRWRYLNYLRGLFPLAGALIAVWTTLFQYGA